MRPYGLLILQLSYFRVLYEAVTMYKVKRLSSSTASPLLISTAKSRSSNIGVDTVMKVGLQSLPSTLNYLRSIWREPWKKRNNIRKSVRPPSVSQDQSNSCVFICNSDWWNTRPFIKQRHCLPCHRDARFSNIIDHHNGDGGSQAKYSHRQTRPLLFTSLG